MAVVSNYDIYSEENLNELFNLTIRKILAYLNIQKNRLDNTLNFRNIEENINDALFFLENPSLDNLEEMLNLVIENSQNLHNPRYMGHQVSAPIPISGAFELLSSVLNQGMTIYEMGPLSSAIERLMISKLCERVGYSSKSGGIVTSGGSLGNLTAILAARGKFNNQTWSEGLNGKNVILVNENSHYSISRAAGIIGIGINNCISIKTKNSKIILEDLIEKIEYFNKKNISILAVIASSCTTKDGVFDDLNAIANVCEKYRIWLHADAAHGGGVIFSEKYKYLTSGLERADSILIDGHKMLSLPALSSYVLFKESKDQYYSVNQVEDYLFLNSNNCFENNPDTGLATIECTKRAATLSFWGVWSLYGEIIFSDYIDKTFNTAREFKSYMDCSEFFEVLNDVEANIILFRFYPDGLNSIGNIKIQSEIRKMLINKGKFYIVEAKHNNIPCLRMTIMNVNSCLLDLIDLEDELMNSYMEMINCEKDNTYILS